MKREYLKPEVFSKEQLNLNEAVAATCTILKTNRCQDSSDRYIQGNAIAEDYSNYGYPNKYAAYNKRYTTSGNADVIEFGLVGPIYKVIFNSDGVEQSFFWEDFNSNGVYDGPYDWLNDVEDYLSVDHPGDTRIKNHMVYGVNDNLQSVSGGTFSPRAEMIDPATGKVVHS